MKEVILVSPKLGIGGIQRALTNLANWLADKDYKVFFISCKKEEVFYEMDPRINLITPEINHPGRGGNIISHYFYIIKFLRKEFKRIPAKHVISFGDAFNPLTLIASIGLRKEIHISDRTSPDYNFKFYVKFLKTFTYPLSSNFIAQTSRAAEWNTKKFGKKLNITVIPNPARRVQMKNVEREKVILYVGRFAWEKAPERLIKSFAAIENKKGFKLRMCGDGPLLEEMKRLAKELQIDDEVDFLGKVNNVDYHLSVASIFVLPSVLEGFPNALCEAMSAGIPSICYSTIPYEDLGDPNKDFLVAHYNGKPDLTACVKLLIDSEQLRLEIGRSAMGINDRLNNHKICEKFEELIIK